MPLGQPLYDYDDPVMFSLQDQEGNFVTKHGIVVVVDAYGTFFQNQEASYDIMVPSENGTWYKHVSEPYVKYDDTPDAATA